MKRRPNFTVSEMDALIDAIAERRAVVSAASNGRVTKSMKEREWLTITAKVNETSSLHRTVAEVRKKWKNLRMVTKAKKEAMVADWVHLCKTGEPVACARQLNPVETRVMEILEAGSISLPHRDDSAAAPQTAREESDSNASASVSYDDEELTAPSNSEIIANASLGRVVTDSADAPVSNLVIDEASDCGASAADGTTFQNGLRLQLEPSRWDRQHKPSILSVVDALQRRLVDGAPTSKDASSRTADGEAATTTAPSGQSATESRRCHGCCHEPQLLEAERQRLQAEREKVAALREIVASLRDVASTMKSMLGVGETST